MDVSIIVGGVEINISYVFADYIKETQILPGRKQHHFHFQTLFWRQNYLGAYKELTLHFSTFTR